MRASIITPILVICLSPFFNYASHFLGGEMFYQHIADVDSNQSTYMISVITYNDSTNQPNQISVDYSSSCNGGGTITLNLVQLTGVFNYGDCVSSRGVKDLLYQASVTLPVRCADWEFEWISFCCMPQAYQNEGAPTGSAALLMLTAELNNLKYNNSSPKYLDPPAHGICQNQNSFYWTQRASEPDGRDSIAYKIDDLVPFSWAPGYSRKNPFGTPGGMTIDSINGIYVFNPSQLGLFLIQTSVEEYRWDTVSGYWERLGRIHRVMSVNIHSDCDSNLSKWGLNRDALLTRLPLPLNCGAARVGLKTSSKFACSTLSHTDFVLYQPDGSVLPIINANGNCINGFSDSIYLDLHMPIQQNGDHYLISKQGFDGNTIISACGFELAQNDTTLIQVKNCNNVSLVEEETNSSLEVFPNPAYNYLEIGGLKPNSKNRRVYSIFSSHGKLVLTDVLENKIDVSSLAPGLYFLEVKGSGNIASHTFSKL